METQRIGFRNPSHRIALMLRRALEHKQSKGFTIKQIAWKYNAHPSIVKDIDRKRLERAFKDRHRGGQFVLTLIPELAS